MRNADIQTSNLLDTTFAGSFSDLQRLVNQLATRNGFWEDDVEDNHSKDAEKICLMHSELSQPPLP